MLSGNVSRASRGRSGSAFALRRAAPSLGSSPPGGAPRVAAVLPVRCSPSFSNIHPIPGKSVLRSGLTSSSRASWSSAWGTSSLDVCAHSVAQDAAFSHGSQDGLPLLVAAIHALVARIGAVVPVSHEAGRQLVARIEAIESREVFLPDPQGLDSPPLPSRAAASALDVCPLTSSPLGTSPSAPSSLEVLDKLAVLEATSEARFAAIAARVDALAPNLEEMVEVIRSGLCSP